MLCLVKIHTLVVTVTYGSPKPCDLRSNRRGYANVEGWSSMADDAPLLRAFPVTGDKGSNPLPSAI